MSESHLAFVGIAPHPPVMVPEVGGEMALEVRASIEAMRDLTERVKACGAETVALISPHAPLEEHAFVAYDGPRLRGDFANFRAPQATVEAPLDGELLDALEETAAAEGYSITARQSRSTSSCAAAGRAASSPSATASSLTKTTCASVAASVARSKRSGDRSPSSPAVT
jgi:aromatic ring-opening dioxygenase LigB subunit